eukprot:6511303-Ditylum_brightwellii.AAC.1
MFIDLTKDDVNDSVNFFWKDPPRTVYSFKNVIPVDDDAQQFISKLDESALTDMMSQVEKRAKDVCAPALAAMKQRQEVLERRLAENSSLSDMSKNMGNNQINILRDKQDLSEKN